MKTFDERRATRRAAPAQGLKVFTADEFADLPRRVTSEERLERLGPDLRAAQRFREKANELKREANLQTRLITAADQLPALAPDTRHKYAYCFDDCRQRLTDGEDLLIAVVIEGSRVIGFGIVVKDKHNAAEIEIIDVDEFSRRSSGLQTMLELQRHVQCVQVLRERVSERCRQCNLFLGGEGQGLGPKVASKTTGIAKRVF